MRKAEATALPVVDGTGRLVGLLTAVDIAEAYRLFSGVPALAARVDGREGQRSCLRGRQPEGNADFVRHRSPLGKQVTAGVRARRRPP
jgi:CBS domain-containing protein